LGPPAPPAPPAALGELGELLLERAIAALGGAEVIAVDELADRARAADRPTLIANPNAPRFGAAHVEAALADLEAGADVSFGPGLVGGWYLVALARYEQRVLDLLEGRGSPFALGLEVGLLRAERLLRTQGDVVALLKDPLVASGVRRLLR
jgi:glycosyltransferase A (GT-A) superfamily protein (DUF2064 family)